MNYEKIKLMLRQKFLNDNQAAKAIGMTLEGFSSMMEKQTMKVKTLEIISNLTNVSPCSFFYDDLEPHHLFEKDPHEIIDELSHKLHDLKKKYKSVKLHNERLTESLLKVIDVYPQLAILNPDEELQPKQPASE